MVHDSTKYDDVEEMEWNVNFTVVLLSNIATPESRMKSYKFDIKLDEVDKVMDPDVWYIGRQCGSYRFPSNQNRPHWIIKTQPDKHAGSYPIFLLGVMTVSSLLYIHVMTANIYHIYSRALWLLDKHILYFALRNDVNCFTCILCFGIDYIEYSVLGKRWGGCAVRWKKQLISMFSQ